MSAFVVIHEPAIVIALRTVEIANANRAIREEIESMWVDEEKCNGDYVKWIDRYASQRYPTLAKYIADNNLTGPIIIYNSW